jgi:hypothetical protein
VRQFRTAKGRQQQPSNRHGLMSFLQPKALRTDGT